MGCNGSGEGRSSGQLGQVLSGLRICPVLDKVHSRGLWRWIRVDPDSCQASSQSSLPLWPLFLFPLVCMYVPLCARVGLCDMHVYVCMCVFFCVEVRRQFKCHPRVPSTFFEILPLTGLERTERLDWLARERQGPSASPGLDYNVLPCQVFKSVWRLTMSDKNFTN